MEKRVSKAFGKKQYLLGVDKNGIYYWLEEATFDCGWYWSIGYVETFTLNKNPEVSRDITSHQHFKGMFLENNKSPYDTFKSFFIERTVDDKELYMLIELMMSLYTARKYADFLHLGGSHYTKNPCSLVIKNKEEYDRINKHVIPELLKNLYILLGDKL